MQILLMGLPYFSELLRNQLSAYKRDWDFRCLKQDFGRLRNIRTSWAIATSDVLYVISGTLGPHAGIRLAQRLGKRIVMHWVGTDVLEAKSALDTGSIDKRYIEGVVHCCEVPWIQEELKAIGIEARVLPLAAIPADESPLPERSTVSVLGYVGKGREAFYGLPRLIMLAEAFPEIPFRVAGIETSNVRLPHNISLLGWVEDMSVEYHRATHYLRLPDHDGLAFSVLEALRWGCEVGYTYPFPGTCLIKNDEDAKKLLREAGGGLEEGKWIPNLAGKNFVNQYYNTEKVLGGLIRVLKS